MTRHAIRYCGIRIEYELERKAVKNLNIRLHPDGRICVSAPRRVEVAQIDAFVEKKAEWLIRHLAEMERESHLRPDGHLHEGMTVYVLGQGYRLHLAEGPLGMDDSQKEQGELVLYLTAGQEVAAKEVYLAWLKAQSGSVFLASLERMLAKTAAEGFCRPTLRVRNMKTRWGSCKPSEGKITLNLQLMKADLDCIDQVMLHELIHLKEPRHNAAFYERMDRYMPDWRQRKERLETEYQDGL